MARVVSPRTTVLTVAVLFVSVAGLFVSVAGGAGTAFADDPPVAAIAPPGVVEGAAPFHLSAAPSTDDVGIVSYRWELPPIRFPFLGGEIDRAEWRTQDVEQDGRLLVQGYSSWARSYFFSTRTRIERGGSLEGRIDTSTGTSYAMVGFKDLDLSTGNYANLVHAI